MPLRFDTESLAQGHRAKLTQEILIARQEIAIASFNQHDVLRIRSARADMSRAEKELNEVDAELYPKE